MAADYTILSQVPRVKVDPLTSELIPVMEIGFRDQQSGVADTVDVPKLAYGPEQVDALIRHRLAAIRQVHSLGG